MHSSSLANSNANISSGVVVVVMSMTDDMISVGVWWVLF